MQKCYCNLNQAYSACCGKFHSGNAKPETAEELMRARYSAYASKNVAYILKTEKLKRVNKISDLSDWVNAVTYVKLEISEKSKGTTADTTGTVTFTATFFYDGKLNVMNEKSSFKRIKDDWIYVGTL